MTDLKCGPNLLGPNADLLCWEEGIPKKWAQFNWILKTLLNILLSFTECPTATRKLNREVNRIFNRVFNIQLN